ncbi:MAG: DUF2281 domain-containing protein [Synechococcales bacterium]|nr:DUF2281 domain-containing protein [Synechococcales bacterium]
MEQIILEQIQRLPASAQQEALRYIEALVAKYIPAQQSEIANQHPLAKFYGCIDDETFIRQPQGELNDRESF